MAELLLGRPLFPGKTEPEELEYIFRVMGTPTMDMWPNVVDLPHYQTMFKNLNQYGDSFRVTHGAKLGDEAYFLLSRMLVADPSKRFPAQLLLKQRYFGLFPIPPEDPTCLTPIALKEGDTCHEFQMKQIRKKRAQESKEQVDTTTNDTAPVSY
jgi:cyclin-dependent kinase 12/13